MELIDRCATRESVLEATAISAVYGSPLDQRTRYSHSRFKDLTIIRQ